MIAALPEDLDDDPRRFRLEALTAGGAPHPHRGAALGWLQGLAYRRARAIRIRGRLLEQLATCDAKWADLGMGPPRFADVRIRLVETTGRDLPRRIDQWPEEWRHEYEERAGILEHCGRLGREQAEAAAATQIRARYARQSQGAPA